MWQHMSECFITTNVFCWLIFIPFNYQVWNDSFQDKHCIWSQSVKATRQLACSSLTYRWQIEEIIYAEVVLSLCSWNSHGKVRTRSINFIWVVPHSRFSLDCRSWCGKWPMDASLFIGIERLISSSLTGGNWQKWKRLFLTCPCHEIYRDEAVGLKVAKILEKLRYL